MTGNTAADFLIRVVLDDAFRELAIDDPQRAFEEYDLSAEQREILAGRSDRILELLGAAAPQSRPSADGAGSKTEPPAAAAALPGLPDVKLVLRLAPHAVPEQGSSTKVAYEASLLPWTPDDASAKSQAPADPPGEIPDSDGAPELSWLVRISPTVVDAEEAGVRVAYSASIRPLVEGAGLNQPPPPAQTPSEPGRTWRHDLESPAVQAAAQAVRLCDTGTRYEKLLELIEAVRPEGRRG